MSDWCVVNVCLTGMIPTRAMSDAVPLTAEEIARDVGACVELGRLLGKRPSTIAETRERLALG